MKLKRRKNRSWSRKDGSRVSKLVVVATEDTYAPKDYFNGWRLASVHIEILETESGKSAPQQVLQRLDEFRKKYDIDEDDDLWLKDEKLPPAKVCYRTCDESSRIFL